MGISRRTLLASGAAAAASAAASPVLATSTPELRARPGTARLAPADYPETAIWGFDGQAPGPTLKVRQGERIRRRFVNNLPQASSVHWHGLRLANAMDGVPGVTQKATPPGGSFLYDFVAPDAGTYWYHPHNRTWEQMARGLYGALVVEEATPPDVDLDEVLLIDDWRLDGEAQIDESFGAMGDWSHGGRLGNWVTVNGDHAYRKRVRAGERLRLRLANVANARIFALEFRGLDGWIVALDGQPLDRPERFRPLTLAPAQRVDVIADVVPEPGAAAEIAARTGEHAVVIATFEAEPMAGVPRRTPPAPLPPNSVPALGDLAGAAKATLWMAGGAMGAMRGARLNGEPMSMRQLVEHGRVWAFNGQADMPEAPLLTVERGRTARIRIVNDTGWPHAMHLHGHHFRRIDRDGRRGPLRDTLLMRRQEETEVAFVADNPGDWLLHCHMLEHAVAGMMTWIRVV